MSSSNFKEEISHIIEEHEYFLPTEEKPEHIAANLENFKLEARREVRDTRRKSIDNSVNNIISNIQNENENLYSLAHNRKSIIDCEFLNTDNRKYVPSSSVPRQEVSIQSSMDRRISQYKARHSVAKPRNFNHLSDWNKTNEQQMKKIIGNKKYLDRVMLNNEKKRYEYEIKIIQKMNKEQRELYNKPKLSKNTQVIINSKSNRDQPIHKRTKEVLAKKSEKMEELKKNVLEETKQVTPIKYAQYDKEKNDKWINEKIEWKKKIKDKSESIKKNMDRIETEGENLLYRPTINKLSETIANFKNSETPDKTIYERLYCKKDKFNETMIELKRNLCPSFNPVLNKPAKKGRVDTELNRSVIETKINYDPIMTKYTVTRENKRPNSLEQPEEEKYVNPDKHWTRVIADINSNNYMKDNSSDLYKINVRSSSAWDMDHLNVIMLNDRMIELFSNAK